VADFKKDEEESGKNLSPQGAQANQTERTPQGLARGPDPSIKGPQQVSGPVGNVTVVPDNYAGPPIPGAILMSRYGQMAAIMGGIQDGTSSVKFDLSSYTAGIDPVADAEKFAEAQRKAAEVKEQYMGYLRDLVQTPTGLVMLQELGSSEHATTINGPNQYGGNQHRGVNEKPGFGSPNEDGSPGEGTASIVNIDPSKESLARPGQPEEPWMTEQPRYGFYHELVHSYYAGRGELANGPDVNGVPASEWQNLGQGPFAENAVTENRIRAEMGKQQRPNYDGVTYDGNLIWGFNGPRPRPE
jgi:hypothetical protein